jgi:hypothetical protein
MSEKPEHVLTSGISILQERALDLIASRSDGVFQSDLRRLLSIDSSKCSKLVSRMQNSGVIYREKVPASSTYLLKLVHASIAPASDENDAAPQVQTSHIGKHIDSHVNGHMESNIDSHVNGHMESNIDSFIDGKINGQVVSYFDCNIDGYIDTDIGNQIDSYFDSQRYTDRHSHIDSFLTEIYLLYLVRGISG